MKTLSKPVAILCLVSALVFSGMARGQDASKKPEALNVLFIAVDDLRPALGCYGDERAITPNIDALAARGTTFLNSYCQQAVCNPSRASLMTSLRPETTGVFDLPTHFRDKVPDAVTVAQHFKNNGYHTERLGKIFHTGHGNRDDKFSWSRMKNYPSAPRFSPEAQELYKNLVAEVKAKGGDPKNGKDKVRGLPWEAPELGDDELTDGSNTATAIQLIKEYKEKGKPFFLGVGFLNPHLPFVAPKRYWDLYDPADMDPAANNFTPKDAPSYAATSWGELRAYQGIPSKGPLSAGQERNMVHGYYAATSYVDACVGRLIAALEEEGLTGNTVIVLWGDHGWQLRDHSFWCKHTNYDVAVRAPLIFYAPGQANPGARSEALVEFVDVFPTLADLCGLDIPDGLEGISLKPVMDKPDRPWKKAVFHVYPRKIPDHGSALGFGMRTERYHLVEWRPMKASDKFREYELYDLQSDPEENTNLAVLPEYETKVKELAGQLAKGWKGALPDS